MQRTAAMNSAGIGLGLTIVKQIIERSGGKIQASSPGPDQGSLFSFDMKMRSALPNSSNIQIMPAELPAIELV